MLAGGRLPAPLYLYVEMLVKRLAVVHPLIPVLPTLEHLSLEHLAESIVLALLLDPPIERGLRAAGLPLPVETVSITLHRFPPLETDR